MKYYVNEKLFSLHRKFYIKDEYENNVYEISSKVISIGDKTTIMDMMGNKVAYIEQEILHFMPHYNVYINDHLTFKIKKKFKILANDYLIDNGYQISGDFLALDFTVYDNTGKEVGNIHRKFISIGDKYEINIYNEDAKEIILSIIVAIANDVNRAQNSSN